MQSHLVCGGHVVTQDPLNILKATPTFFSSGLLRRP